MAIYLKWQTTAPDTQDRFTANLFANLSKRWYPVNIIGSNLYDVLSMYGAEFASGSTLLTQTLNDLSVEDVREGFVDGHDYSKMYENFGELVGANKLPYQQYTQFDTGSVVNGYRETLKFLMLASTEGSTADAVARIGQAINGMSPVIVEPIWNYQGFTLTTYTGSVYASFSNADAKRQYVVVNPAFGRFGHLIPVVTGSVVPTGSTVSLSFDVLNTNTYIYSKEFYESGAFLYFFVASGSAGQMQAVQNLISQQVGRLIPANVQPIIKYDGDFVLWKPVGPLQDSFVSGSSVFAVNSGGWVYNAAPTSPTGSTYVTDVIQLPA